MTFYCAGCGKNINVRSSYFVRNGQKYCQKCRRHNKIPRKEKEPIIKPYVFELELWNNLRGE